jgi:hypothetical protein
MTQKSRKLALTLCVSGLLIVIGVRLAVPHFVRARAGAPWMECINNMRIIQGAKDQWALENDKSTNSSPTWDDIRPYIGSNYLGSRKKLICPEGGTYTLGKVGDLPTCSIGGYHSLP